jgi:hypothetical protein
VMAAGSRSRLGHSVGPHWVRISRGNSGLRCSLMGRCPPRAGARPRRRRATFPLRSQVPGGPCRLQKHREETHDRRLGGGPCARHELL